MVLTSDQARIQHLISDTIMLLCKNGLCFRSQFSVDAVIGITLDDSDVFLVSIRETIQQNTDSMSTLLATDSVEIAKRVSDDVDTEQDNTDCVDSVEHDTGNEKTSQLIGDIVSNRSTLIAKTTSPDMFNQEVSGYEVGLKQSVEAVRSPLSNYSAAGSKISTSVPTAASKPSSSDFQHTDQSSPTSVDNVNAEEIQGIEYRPMKKIRLNDSSEISCENARLNINAISCQSTIKSEPLEVEEVTPFKSGQVMNNISNNSIGCTVLKKTNRSTSAVQNPFDCTPAVLDCRNQSHNLAMKKFTLVSTACASRRTSSPNSAEKPEFRFRGSGDYLNPVHGDIFAKVCNPSAIASSSRQTSSLKPKPSNLVIFPHESDLNVVTNGRMSPDRLCADNAQQLSVLCAERALKFPWCSVDSSENSLKDLQYFSDDFKPAADLFRNSLDWTPAMKSIYTREPFNYSQYDDPTLQLPEHVARDCIQTILLYDGRYVPVRDIQRLRLCGTSSGMIRAAMIMLDDLHQGTLGSYRELPTGVALLYKCPPERVDVEKLKTYGVGIDIYHMRYHTIPSVNATTRHCDGYWQRIESYSPYI